MKLPLAFLVILPTLVSAQTPGPAAATPMPQVTSQPLWRAQLPGGTYEVAIRSLVSVSSHEYVVDGIARVTEVNIDTTGALLARFYYIEPNAPNAPAGVGAATLEKTQQLLTEAADRSGQEAWKKVVKNYPTTTHARTVEYRLASKEELHKLFESAESAFRLGRNTVFKAGSGEGSGQ